MGSSLDEPPSSLKSLWHNEVSLFHFAQNTKGFTLIEVMVLLIVVTFGLLALISMKASALRKETPPEHILLAKQIVRKVEERILENASNVHAYDGMRTATNTRKNCPDQSPEPSCLQDFSEWKKEVSALPQGDLTIRLVSNNTPEKVTVDLSWHDNIKDHNISVPIRLTDR